VIRLTNVAIQAGDFALRDVFFEVPTGHYGVLMGKTGSGKTTLLESVIGLRQISAGMIELDGVDVTRLRPALRAVGYVPQDGALFSQMTVRQQIALALVIRRAPDDEIERRVDFLAEMLGIVHLLDRTPKGLSGGERQRVALGRALSFRPRVLCLDEPLSALDDETRQQMYRLLKEVRQRSSVTVLHVTHSFQEAEVLADCLLRVEDGSVARVKGVGNPG
jgi:ABC-type sugar transport system ATPase subunit